MGAAPFEAREETANGRVRVLALSGELDMASTAAFEQRLLESIDGGGPLILDLSKVTFMDSTAVGVLVTARRKANLSRGRFAVVCGPGDIERMLSYTGLDVAFDIAETRGEAMLALNSL
jgi:anti-sigma B factor antagonist